MSHPPCITVVVADRALLAEGVRVLLEPSGEVDVRGVATCPTTVAETVEELRPDVLVLGDQLLAGTGGTQLVTRLRRAVPETKIVLLAGYDDRPARAAVAAGCSGVLATSSNAHDLLSAIRAVHRGEPVLPPSICNGADRCPPTVGRDLTRRELEVLRLLAEGTMTADIAEHLYVSRDTIRNHVQHILKKLGVHSRVAAVTLALREGLVDPA